VGCALFIRAHHNVSLTEEGETLLPLAEDVMSDAAVRRDVRQVLDFLASARFPSVEDQTPEAARASLLAGLPQVDLPMGELATVTDLAVPGPAGAIPARLLDPRPTRGAGPVVIWFHGGGWVTGGIDTHQSLCAQVARQLDLPVVLVGYRRAPEAPFPAAPDDAVAAARWVAGSPAQMGRGVDSLVLAGDSAGGTLAIVAAMALRDEPAAAPVIAHLAIYPATDETREYPSADEFADGYLLTKKAKAWYRDQYRPIADDPRASPLLGDPADLPPAVVLTAGLDPNRDEGRAYAAALISAGVPTVFREAKGNIHAFALMRQVIPSSQLDITGALNALRQLIDESDRVNLSNDDSGRKSPGT
jgi:acetyl esterase